MWVAIAAGFIIALPSLWMCSQALWPAASERRAKVSADGMIRTLLTGLIPLFFTALLLSKLGKLGLAGVIPLGALLLWGFIGADGLATTIGRRICPYLGESRPWKQTMRGGFIIIGAALLPIVGWFVVLPLILTLGWGSSLRSLRGKAPPPLSESAIA